GLIVTGVQTCALPICSRRRREIPGGPAMTLADAPGFRGGAWNREGLILFGRNVNGPLYRITSAGGSATAITTLDATRNQTAHSRSEERRVGIDCRTPI